MKLDDLKKLHQKKYRQQFGCYLIEGEHLLLELERSPVEAGANVEVYVTESFRNWETRFKVTEISSKRMAQLSDTASPQGIVARIPLPVDASLHNRRNELTTIYLFEPQDPGNLGTILRTLAWFGGYQLALSPNSVDPFNMKVVRASMGALFHVPIIQNVAIDELNVFERVAYLDIQGEDVNDSSFRDFGCYIFGNEARGVPEAVSRQPNAQAFTIRGSGQIESLNLASAVNMCAFRLSTP